MMKRDGIPVFFLLLLLLPWGSLPAAQVKGLYAIEVPVAGQETDQRNEAISRAFGLMLVKVTGNRSMAGRPELADAIRKAPRYVQQYQYRLQPDAAPVDSVEPPAEPPRLLKVTFDRNAVERLLREKHLSVWDGNRPNGMIWLGLDVNGQRRLGLPDADVEVYQALSSVSGSRGIALIYPLMDLEDQAGVQVADLWGDFESNLRRASRRYTPDLIVNGRLVAVTDTLWRAQWSFYLGEQVVRWSDEARDAGALAAQGAERIADLLAERFAPVSGDNALSQVSLRVEGVDDFTGYLAAAGFLRSQGVVDHVGLLFVEPDAATFSLRVRGGLQALEQGLGLGGVMQPVAAVTDSELPLSGPVDLTYRLK